jgi:hypothetical protein
MERIANMRGVIAVVLGATVVLAGPSFAKTSEVPKAADEPSSSSPCHAYEQGPDGSWKQLPCQEDGLKPQATPTVSTRDLGKAPDTGKATR